MYVRIQADTLYVRGSGRTSKRGEFVPVFTTESEARYEIISA